MVSPSPVPQEEASGEQQVERLHAALRQCLGLLHSVLLKEEEEWGEQEEDYETLKKNVRHRLEHLLLSTRGLLEGPDTTLEVTPDHQGTEVTHRHTHTPHTHTLIMYCVYILKSFLRSLT